MLYDGIEVGDVTPCKRCGRAPEMATGYKGFDGGGPYIITCSHGNSEEVIEAWRNRSLPRVDDPIPFALCRSWDAQRAVDLWNSGNAA